MAGKPLLRFFLRTTAIARGDGIAVRAGGRMTKETANALIELRADDVLEFARLTVCFMIIDAKSVLEQALSKAMPANDVTRAILAAIGQ